MRRRWLGWLSAVMLGVALGAAVSSCGSGAPPSDFYRIAVHSKDGGQLEARAEGLLGGSANSNGTACLWLGSGTDRTALIWPAGFTAKGHPLTVFDGDGKRVAAVGEWADIGGGLSDIPFPPLLGCAGISKAWTIGTVIASGHAPTPKPIPSAP